MTLYWIYDLPNWLFGVVTVAAFNAIAVGGLLLSRPLARRLLGASSRHNDVVSFFFAGVGVFYGLALGLIAVGTWEDYTGVDALVGKEAVALASLYRDFDAYPPADRDRLENVLRDYTRHVVEVEWPAHRKGEAPEEGTLVLDRLENEVMAFEPSHEREKIAHAEVRRTLTEVFEHRRERLQSVTTALSASLWSVVLIGALLNFALTYMFWVENQALHVALVATFATFVALLVFITAAMDNPFRGEFSVAPDALRTVLDTVMRPSPSKP